MGYPYLHFFNLQYWYCVIVSLFGARCTEAQLIAGGLATSTESVSVPGGNANVSFWDWLFGIHNSGVGNPSGPTGILGTIFSVIGAIFGFLWGLYSAIAYTLSFLLFLLILGSLIGLFLIRMQDHERYGNLAPAAERPHPLRERWQALLENAMSSDPKRWREGILGADLLLGELFTRLGYQGNSTAEQIRRVPDDAFANLTAAWEAHRIKNFVSSPSSHFILTQREAFRVMKLYERVFKEFDFV